MYRRTYAIGNLQMLVKMYSAAQLDLVRMFKAVKKGNSYEVPLENLPWATVIDLGQQYRLISDGKPLTLTNASLTKMPHGTELIVGFLASDGNIYGSSIGVGRPMFKCRRTPLERPLDLWDAPGNISMPQVQAIVEDLAYAESINVSAPVKCVEDPNLETRKLVVYSWLVSILDKATIDLTKSELTYI
ncbi:hypothetical protein GCM10007981_10970 [Thermocladium modestius]|uniref:Uncharacterized protein n=1 Tax=Thermocladium modestius TaxID=62609 RepID=A0A830GWD9_9CREN|nr:hypothetical protein [Thermocladium modestius]GGP20926.1 hypothetical protein GCM10007981_10970 [Thermocladium modestius]